jgi:hypothetical protein
MESKKVSTHHFCESWLKKYEWLTFDRDKRVMKCNTCCQMKLENTFTAGCTNYRTTTLDRHEQSKKHIDATKSLNLQKYFKKAVKNAEVIEQKSESESIGRRWL